MKLNFKLILSYALLLLSGFILLFYLYPYLPEKIPHTPIIIHGALIWVLVISIIILVSKKLKSQNENIQYGELILTAMLVTMLSELTFQIIRQFTMEIDTFGARLVTIGKATFTFGVLSLLISFFTAYQLKTKKTETLILMIIGTLIIAKFALDAMGY